MNSFKANGKLQVSLGIQGFLKFNLEYNLQ